MGVVGGLSRSREGTLGMRYVRGFGMTASLKHGQSRGITWIVTIFP